MSIKQTSSVTSNRGSRRGKKYFDVAEANRALPYVSRIVEDISSAYRHALDIKDRIDHPHPEDAPEALRNDYEQSMDRLNELVDELRQVGVELKDFEKGLLDFPAQHDGREIYLCWHRGEKAVENWHEVDAGYAGRQAVTLLEKPN